MCANRLRLCNQFVSLPISVYTYIYVKNYFCFIAGTALLLVLLSHASDARSTKLSCPLGLPPLFCLVEPCTELTNDKCIDDSKATCRVDTCTGCKRHFVDSDGKRIPSVQCKLTFPHWT